MAEPKKYPSYYIPPKPGIDYLCVMDAERLVYRLGKDYAICPGRGKRGLWWNPKTGNTADEWLKACAENGMDISIWGDSAASLAGYKPARIRILNICLEQVGEISQEDARKEGFKDKIEFLQVFLGINPKAKVTDEVWVIDFEVVK